MEFAILADIRPCLVSAPVEARQAGLLPMGSWSLLAAHCLALSLLVLVAWRLHRAGCRRTRQESGDERMAAIGNLAAGIAHEIRNPLNTISLTCRYIERMLARADLDTPVRDEVNRNFEVISSEVGRLTRTLDSFLLLAPPESIRLAGTDLDNVVDEALTLFRRDLDTHHVELEREREEPVRVSADPDRLCQVFANIVRNAIEAMPDGGTLSVATGVEADRAHVTFTDTGCGIGAQDLARVFEPYFTTKRSGLGVGLALSLKTMAAHGGTIEAASQAGRGATFTVVLPTEASHG